MHTPIHTPVGIWPAWVFLVVAVLLVVEVVALRMALLFVCVRRLPDDLLLRRFLPAAEFEAVTAGLEPGQVRLVPGSRLGQRPPLVGAWHPLATRLSFFEGDPSPAQLRYNLGGKRSHGLYVIEVRVGDLRQRIPGARFYRRSFGPVVAVAGGIYEGPANLVPAHTGQ